MNQSTNSNYIKGLQILFLAMLFGQLIFTGVVAGLVTSGSAKNTNPGLENIFFILVPALIIAGRLTGTSLYKKKIQEALNAGTVTEKLNLYRAAFIMRCALLEGAVLFGIIAYFITSRIELLLFVAGGIILFILLKPTKDKVVSELQTSAEEIE